MDLRQVRYFLAVADQGGVHRAAETLYVAQPSVSQAVRSLEKELGAQLFYRTNRGLVLTPAGEALIPAAREVLHGLELARSVVDAVGGLRGGRLVISSISSQTVSPLAPMIGRFLTSYPDVQVTVRAAVNRDDVVSALRVGDAELGVIARPLTELPTAELASHPVQIQHYLCLARDADSFPPGTAPLRPDELAGARLIVGQRGTGMRRAADLILTAAEGSRAVVEIEHREALIPLVLQNVGIAVVADAFRGVAQAAGLAIRQLDVREELAVELVHRPGPVSPAAQVFLDMAAGGFKD